MMGNPSLPTVDHGAKYLGTWKVLFWSSLLVLLYVLSVGPVVKLVLENQIPQDTIETVYAPLVWLCDTPMGEKVVKPCLVWYGETIWQWEVVVK